MATGAEPALEQSSRWATESVESSLPTRPQQMAKLFGYLKGLHATHLMAIGTELGLFAHLAAAPEGLHPAALAADLGLHPRYVRLWCETACALELLDYDPATGYRFAPGMDELLGRPDATFYCGLFPHVHLHVARDYARYPALFRTGGVFPYQEHDAAFLRAVAEATQTLPRMFLDTVLPKLPRLRDRLEREATMLDVGCGGGYALVAFAERYPGLRAVGIDVEPMSVGMAQELIRARGLGARVAVRLVDGASWPEEYAGAFDLATQFLVLHEIRPDLKPAALARCAQALRPGGTLLLCDERYPGGPAELRDPQQNFAAVAQWFEMTWGNAINTQEEIHALLADQGLRVADETGLSRFYVVAAEKRG